MDGYKRGNSTCPLCGRLTAVQKTGSDGSTGCPNCRDTDRFHTDREYSDAVQLYRKVKHTVDKGKDAAVKRKLNGELCVYEVDMKLAR